MHAVDHDGLVKLAWLKQAGMLAAMSNMLIMKLARTLITTSIVLNNNFYDNIVLGVRLHQRQHHGWLAVMVDFVELRRGERMHT